MDIMKLTKDGVAFNELKGNPYIEHAGEFVRSSGYCFDIGMFEGIHEEQRYGICSYGDEMVIKTHIEAPIENVWAKLPE